MSKPLSIDDLPFPRWAYVPGQDAHVDHDVLARVKTLVPKNFTDFVPLDLPPLRYGLALNDAGFFWEAHEILEAIWTVTPQGGRDRILLRACIQIANANLKVKMHRPSAAQRLFVEALDELRELAVRRPKALVGESFADSYPANTLANQVAVVVAQSTSNTTPIRFDQATKI